MTLLPPINQNAGIIETQRFLDLMRKQVNDLQATVTTLRAQVDTLQAQVEVLRSGVG